MNQDSRDQWVVLDARNTFHRVTSVESDRVSVIYHTPQHLDRLRQDDWDVLRDSGLPVDQLWEGGLLKGTLSGYFLDTPEPGARRAPKTPRGTLSGHFGPEKDRETPVAGRGVRNQSGFVGRLLIFIMSNVYVCQLNMSSLTGLM